MVLYLSLPVLAIDEVLKFVTVSINGLPYSFLRQAHLLIDDVY